MSESDAPKMSVELEVMAELEDSMMQIFHRPGPHLGSNDRQIANRIANWFHDRYSIHHEPNT